MPPGIKRGHATLRFTWSLRRIAVQIARFQAPLLQREQLTETRLVVDSEEQADVGQQDRLVVLDGERVVGSEFLDQKEYTELQLGFCLPLMRGTGEKYPGPLDGRTRDISEASGCVFEQPYGAFL